MKLIRILKKLMKCCLPYGIIRFWQIYRKSITLKNLKKLMKCCLPYGIIRFIQIYNDLTIKKLLSTKDISLDITSKSHVNSNKKVVLYNATVLTNGYLEHSSRTGIYTVAYNILLQLALSNKYEIKLYSNQLEILEKFLKQEALLKNVSVIKLSMIDKIHYIILYYII